MKQKIADLLSEIAAVEIKTAEELEAFRIKFSSKKGILSGLFEEFKSVASDQKKEMGLLLNQLKASVQNKYDELQLLARAETPEVDLNLDISLPVTFREPGSRHPVSMVRNKIIGIFNRIGFSVSDGPEIEDDFHNFTALNFPPDHPARDMQDTFFLERDPDIALRTHTSSIQVRVMENAKPPIRTLAPGRVFRNEAISARAHVMFHQIEGLYIDENVSFADLKQTLYYFARQFFGQDTRIRFRPSYFPFTEPSAEMDISCFLCQGKGCRICKNSGWVEILGCGMVDPSVLDTCGISSVKYTGFAFGMGIERIAMLKYQINDIRLLFENDIRFLKQFSAAV